MTRSHILGFPRIGANRETKKAVEAYWRGAISQVELEAIGRQIRHDNWKIQAEAGLDFVTVGDFSWYDHVLDTSALLGVIPERFGPKQANVDLNTIFCMGRGQAPNTNETSACEMTKWFNTNYHYIVPEFNVDQTFSISSHRLFDAIDEAQALGHQVKPVLVGPLTYLWLGKAKGSDFDRLQLLDRLLPAYQEIIKQLHARKITWVQIDEPILVLDLPKSWQKAFVQAYQQLDFSQVNCLLATYFDKLNDNQSLVNQLPVQGIHVDFSSNPEQLLEFTLQFPANKILSAGVISGRNIWKNDLNKTASLLKQAHKILGERLWVASSCSLLHVPVDLNNETLLDAELKNWLAFAVQKIDEVALLANVLKQGEHVFAQQLAQNQAAIDSRRTSKRIHNPAVAARLQDVTEQFATRKSKFAHRAEVQRQAFNLPLFPTTTIGSFPQTHEIRVIRQDYKAGKIDSDTYIKNIQQQIADVIQIQEQLDLDVLVHGEAERNDMVEYFGELLDGFAFTSNGWVQSYGSRCVKPPIIYGDVTRPAPMTVFWTQNAQKLTKRPVKGMLTGPVTILAWSFVRDDQPLKATALQIALALRDEVTDLEKANVNIIQIDEPAFREALPLHKKDWQHYLEWAVLCFRVASCGANDTTQIHTHMCYSEFNDFIEAIANLDADVITIESSRSEMELLKAFESFSYPNDIGPGVYDIHSPRVPATDDIVSRLENAIQYVPLARLWINPDCGLKTRNWPEVKEALTNMVSAAKLLRAKYEVEENVL